MGASKSKPEPVPKGPEVPEWVQEVHLAPARIEKNPLMQKPPVFKYELSERTLDTEFKRKVALECTRRCLHSDSMTN